MNDIAYVTALALAAVFAWAAVAKLRDRPTTSRGLGALGLPGPGVLAVVVPAVELVLAAALVVAPTVGAAGATAALAVFTVVLARALGRGVRVGCGCFGAGQRDRISPADLVRNGILLAAAVVAGGADSPRLPAIEAVLVVAGAAALALLVIALVDLRVEVGPLFGRPTPTDGAFAGLPDPGPTGVTSREPTRQPPAGSDRPAAPAAPPLTGPAPRADGRVG